MNISRVLHRLELASDNPWISTDEYFEYCEAIWLLRFLRTLPDEKLNTISDYLRSRHIVN